MTTAPDADDGLVGRAGAEIARWLAEPPAAGLYIVATPIGNLGDITLRALATLANADLICCEDTRHSRTLLAHFGINRPLRAYHEHNAETERPHILRLIGDGRAVALISDAGTPLVSDPGYKLVRAVVEAGHQVHALPGASAVLSALAIGGLPTDAFLFAGFLPNKEGQRRTRLEELAHVPATLVLFEAPGRVVGLLGDIATVLGDREVVVARELTKRFEEVRRGTATEMAVTFGDRDIKGEIVVLVAPPAVRTVSDADIALALDEALATLSLRDAARQVAESLVVSRSRVYDLGLKVRAGKA